MIAKHGSAKNASRIVRDESARQRRRKKKNTVWERTENLYRKFRRLRKKK